MPRIWFGYDAGFPSQNDSRERQGEHFYHSRPPIPPTSPPSVVQSDLNFSTDTSSIHTSSPLFRFLLVSPDLECDHWTPAIYATLLQDWFYISTVTPVNSPPGCRRLPSKPGIPAPRTELRLVDPNFNAHYHPPNNRCNYNPGNIQMQGQTNPNVSSSRPVTSTSPVSNQSRVPMKNTTEVSHDTAWTSNELEPEFIKRLVEQVTEQVIKSLQNRNVANIAAHLTQSSPSQSQTESAPPSHTPPSPSEDVERRAMGAVGNSFVEPVSSDTDKHSSDPNPTDRALNDDPSIKTPSEFHGPTSPRRSSRRDSGYPGTDTFDMPPRSPEIPRGTNHSDSVTTLEKVWQPLFHNGKPTARLGQLLRGLAQFLIDDYEPKASLVITPTKMLRFFEYTKVANERYPFATIYGGRMANESIGLMYRKLLCQYHLVQVSSQEQPSVPGLTAFGFENFLTCFIQAHPDIEFERLAKAIRDMPITNADDRSERFPKELPRRLLPAQREIQAEQRLISSLVHEPNLIQLRGATNTMPPPPPSTPPGLNTSGPDRGRNSYSGSFQRSSSIDEEDFGPATVVLERSRKPYFAKQGSGRMYDAEDDPRRSRLSRTESNTSPSRQFRADPMGGRLARHNSATTYSNANPSDPQPIPPAGSNRRRLSSSQSAVSPNGGHRAFRRASSPTRRANTRSDPIDSGSSLPSPSQSQFPPNTYTGPTRDSPTLGNSFDDWRFDNNSNNNSRRHPPPEQSNSTNSTNDHDLHRRARSIPRRSGSIHYDSAMPPSSPPYSGNNAGGFNSTTTTNIKDVRRGNSWYGPPGPTSAPGGGTDKYSISLPSNSNPPSPAAGSGYPPQLPPLYGSSAPR